MKKLEQKADELVDKHKNCTSLMLSEIGATKHAIIDIENTIKALEEVCKIQQIALYWLREVLDEQIQLKKILEGRL